MVFATKMIIATVAALAFVSQISCKPFAPVYGAAVPAYSSYYGVAPVASSVTTHTLHHAAVPAYPAVAAAAYPAAVAAAPAYPAVAAAPAFPAVAAAPAIATTHVAAPVYGARYAAAVPAALSSTTYHYPHYPAAAAYNPYAYSYPGAYGYPYATGFHAPIPAATTTFLHKK